MTQGFPRTTHPGATDITKSECLYVGHIDMESALFDPLAAVNF